MYSLFVFVSVKTSSIAIVLKLSLTSMAFVILTNLALHCNGSLSLGRNECNHLLPCAVKD
jgi:hypothetical protein